ncbi:amylo-alpha-1,6-glucosidase [Leptolyngbya ohadii]|uniref:amylo-alpha-1,6-glucosidase n=1 Tax=Leptolyngbya ohadii TaxID=1962290 RepID=UPI0021F1525A|nr:amylo-alpha-1,6-glucosidase [Leptolyngbya ohadii]
MDRIHDRDTREWLLTNGIGGFACGTVCDAHTRTYHGWLMAALEPPAKRTLLLSRIDAAIEVGGQKIPLGVNFWVSGAIAPQGDRLLRSFTADPVPTWIWGQTGGQTEEQTEGEMNWQLQRRLIMPYGLLPASQRDDPPGLRNRTLIHYSYKGNQPARLILRPLIADRTLHYQQREQPDLQFVQLVESNRVLLQAKTSTRVGTSWQLSWTVGTYEADGLWYRDYHYPEETKRGLADREDLYSPGRLTVSLQPGETVTIGARVRDFDRYQAREMLDNTTFDRLVAAEQERLKTVFAPYQYDRSNQESNQKPSVPLQLLQASDRFIVYRAVKNRPTMIAGYPWFSEWGRDTLIALPGMALTTKRYDLAKDLLRTCSDYCDRGLIPNRFPDERAEPSYGSMDVGLWWIEALGLYLEATQDWAFLVEQYPTVGKIYKGLTVGTLHNIRVDAADNLVTWDVPNLALTWMDALVADQPVTPRKGKPIEVNALWYSALCWAAKWAEQLQQSDRGEHLDRGTLANQARRYSQQAIQVKQSLQKFWNPAANYLFDCISPDDIPDASIRPNAAIALSLSHCAFDTEIGQPVMQTVCDRLLTPYGLRSLDPADPRYEGRYEGGIWQRDRAYHQGAVWSWLVGAFVRGWRRFYPGQAIPFDPEPLWQHVQQQAGLGFISEIFDGDTPHLPRGAFAQAWSVAELLRHWEDIHWEDVHWEDVASRSDR